MLANLVRSSFALVVCTPAAFAQCAEWVRGFSSPAPGPTDDVMCAVSFDDGSGPKLYLPHQLQISRWNGTSWDFVRGGSAPGLGFGSLRVANDAGVPVLLTAERKIASPLTNLSNIWRWDGSTWTQLGSLPFLVYALDYLDDGTGVALFAAGGTTSGVGRVARWNGTSWLDVGPALPNPPITMASVTFGGSPQLYIGGSPNFLGTNSQAVWNGSAWVAVPGLNEYVRSLRAFDPGTGEKLYAANLDANSPSSLYEFDGANWTTVGGWPTSIYQLEVVDLGAGPRLLISGGPPQVVGTFDGATVSTFGAFTQTFGGPVAFTAAAYFDGALPHVFALGAFTSAGGVVCDGFAEWNGATWRTAGKGFFPRVNQAGTVRALAQHDFGSGSELVAAGSFNGTGGGAINVYGVARWNGTNWNPIGSGVLVNPAEPVAPYAIASVDFGAGPRLFAGGTQLQGFQFRGLVAWNGGSWSPPILPDFGNVLALHAFTDGGGTKLIVAGQFGAPTAVGSNILAYDGTTATPLGAGLDGIASALAVHNDGSGDALYAGGAFDNAGGTPAARVARWDGSNWSALGLGIGGGNVSALCSFDDGTGARLYASGTFTLADGAPVNHLARWNGTAWSDLPGGGANGAVLTLTVHDDGRGAALYAGGGFSSIGGITAYNIARFDGTSWEAVDGGIDGAVHTLVSHDDDADGDAELFAGGDFIRTATVSSGRIARLEGCPHYVSFCSGDGALADHTTPCPCANDGAPGHGCASGANPEGARLEAGGSTQLDTVVLATSGTGLTALGVYLQHDAPGDRVFHDGVLCAGGNLLRLRYRSAVGGASQFPDPAYAIDATTTLAQRGFVTPGSGVTRFYSVFYRAAASTFCPPATANVTNGVRVIW